MTYFEKMGYRDDEDYSYESQEGDSDSEEETKETPVSSND